MLDMNKQGGSVRLPTAAEEVSLTFIKNTYQKNLSNTMWFGILIMKEVQSQQRKDNHCGMYSISVAKLHFFDCDFSFNRYARAS